MYSVGNAGIAQLVECQLPKLNVAGSNPVARSKRDLGSEKTGTREDAKWALAHFFISYDEQGNDR